MQNVRQQSGIAQRKLKDFFAPKMTSKRLVFMTLSIEALNDRRNTFLHLGFTFRCALFSLQLSNQNMGKMD